MGQSGCPTEETCAWEESLRGENESHGILPFFSEAYKNGWKALDMVSMLCNVEFENIL